MAGRVVVVGSLNVDLAVTGPRLPGPGETITGGRFERSHGGKGGNQAVAAAAARARTAFVGAVGGDALGGEARAALAAAGVDVAGLLILESEATGVALIVVDAAGENQIAVASGANGALTPAHVAAALGDLDLEATDVVLVSHEIPTATAREALRLARAVGARTILNPAPATGLDRSTFGLADLLTPNRTELAELVRAERRRTGAAGSGPADRDDVARTAPSLLQRSSEGDGVREAVLVTLGSAGAMLVRLDRPLHELPAPVVEVVDTVGAGDAFNGALAAALVAGLDLEAAAKEAVEAAGLATTRRGARPELPDGRA
jgi:ribokinase